MRQEMMQVTGQITLAPNIYELELRGALVQEMHIPGQFLHLKVPQADLLLRRPISISSIDKGASTCRLIYRVDGQGTAIFSTLKETDTIDVLGPLGNGFSIDNLVTGTKVALLGGGIGIPPLYELSRQLRQKGVQAYHFLGYTSKDLMYYEKEFSLLGPTYVATEDGSYGLRGHVGHLLAVDTHSFAAAFACGPNGLLKTVTQTFAHLENVQLSLEARMACGIGACYACICPSISEDTQPKSVKVCDEGPVFQAEEVIL